MAPTHVFVVGSPLQVLNAYEAKEVFCGQSDRAVLVLMCPQSHDDDTHSQLRAAVCAQSWERIIYLYYAVADRGPIRYVYNYRTMLKELERKLAPFAGANAVYIGDYNDLMCHMANIVGGKVILLDDGMKTMAVPRLRCMQGNGLSNWRLEIKNLCKRLLGLRAAAPKKLTYFTCFDLETSGNDDIVRNHYSRTRSRVAGDKTINEIWFVGQPLVEDRLVTRDDYLRALKFVIDTSPNVVARYVPHRRESRDNLRDIQRLGFEIYWLNRAFETEYMASPARPAVVAAFFSTALVTLNALRCEGSELVSYEIESRSIRQRSDHVARIYDYLKALPGVTVTTINRDACGSPVPSPPGFSGGQD